MPPSIIVIAIRVEFVCVVSNSECCDIVCCSLPPPPRMLSSGLDNDEEEVPITSLFIIYSVSILPTIEYPQQ